LIVDDPQEAKVLAEETARQKKPLGIALIGNAVELLPRLRAPGHRRDPPRRCRL
jgi:urocanate hydratase